MAVGLFGDRDQSVWPERAAGAICACSPKLGCCVPRGLETASSTPAGPRGCLGQSGPPARGHWLPAAEPTAPSSAVSFFALPSWWVPSWWVPVEVAESPIEGKSEAVLGGQPQGDGTADIISHPPLGAPCPRGSFLQESQLGEPPSEILVHSTSGSREQERGSRRRGPRPVALGTRPRWAWTARPFRRILGIVRRQSRRCRARGPGSPGRAAGRPCLWEDALRGPWPQPPTPRRPLLGPVRPLGRLSRERTSGS